MRTLVIGDLHLPAVHPKYMNFIRDVRDSWETEATVFIGDVVDIHQISRHPADVSAKDSKREYEEALKEINRWYNEFPKAIVTIGNHDERITRMASTVKIPPVYLKDYADVWHTPGWKWVREHTIDKVHYTHGTGTSGVNPSWRTAMLRMQSTVLGHHHSQAGVHWLAGPTNRVFGMDVGCGVDIEHVAMRYGQNMIRKPVLGCGVVIDGIPFHEIMQCGPKERYRR